jgi:hypothetical protein
MLGGQLQDEDIPPGGFDDVDFNFQGFGPEQTNNNQVGNHGPVQQPLLPDLNVNPMEEGNQQSNLDDVEDEEEHHPGHEEGIEDKGGSSRG